MCYQFGLGNTQSFSPCILIGCGFQYYPLSIVKTPTCCLSTPLLKQCHLYRHLYLKADASCLGVNMLTECLCTRIHMLIMFGEKKVLLAGH